jgi:plasmid stabilization system protein ParE
MDGRLYQWSEQALLDVEHIRDYIAQNSPAYARPFFVFLSAIHSGFHNATDA